MFDRQAVVLSTQYFDEVIGIESIYLDGTYVEKNNTWHAECAPYKAGQIEKMIKRNELSFKSVVEVGCGSGMIVYELSKIFPDLEIEGFDISPQAARLWNKLPKNNIAFKTDNFLLSKKEYDLLCLIDVFEHIPDYMSFLKAISPRANSFIFHIPLDMNVQGIMRDLPTHFRETVGHLHYFSKDTALKTLEDCGYIIVDDFYTPRDLVFASKSNLKKSFLNAIRKVLFQLSPDLTVKLLGG